MLISRAIAERRPMAVVFPDDAERAVVSLARRPGPISPAVEAFIQTARGVAARLAPADTVPR